MIEPEIWTIKDLAKFLKVKPHAIYSLTRQRAADSGRAIPVLRLPCGMRFLRSDVMDWLEKSRT